jgi:glycosyltransferase involved in cell wall biosynthesis
MKISFTTVSENLQTANGYGIAGFNIVTNLQKLGHEVPFRDPTAPVELGFVQPDRIEWSNPKAHHILLTPWESSVIPREWDAGIRSADEFWTTSTQCKKWFESNGYPVANVYPHGVNAMWTPQLRKRGQVLKFLAVGEPAVRKNGQMIYDAFRQAFGDQQDVSLTIKGHTMSTIRGPGNLLPQHLSKNVKVITTEYEDEEMVRLHHMHHVSVTASSGEGFGLIPLQGIVTGMPTIGVSSWAEYGNFILPELRVRAYEAPSPWPDMHPGNVYFPSKESLVNIMRFTYNNYKSLAQTAYDLAPHVARRYDWQTLTRKAFADVVARFG